MTTYFDGRAYVRCLGPGEEHWFLSSDRCKHRICNRCAKKLAYLRARILDSVFVVNPEHRAHSTAERSSG